MGFMWLHSGFLRLLFDKMWILRVFVKASLVIDEALFGLIVASWTLLRPHVVSTVLHGVLLGRLGAKKRIN